MSDSAQSNHLVQLSGPITANESNELRETLLLALADGGDLVVDLEISGPWDLAGLQLLVSLAASGRKREKTIRFVQVPRVCVDIAERAGLEDWLRSMSDSML